VIAHAPHDRPASGRVLEKAGFAPGELLEDDGMRVRRWELALRPPTGPQHARNV
jgi:hypothetical protein